MRIKENNIFKMFRIGLICRKSVINGTVITITTTQGIRKHVFEARLYHPAAGSVALPES